MFPKVRLLIDTAAIQNEGSIQKTHPPEQPGSIPPMRTRFPPPKRLAAAGGGRNFAYDSVYSAILMITWEFSTAVHDQAVNYLTAHQHLFAPTMCQKCI